jgi:serine/threonine-protein kinase RsbW
MVAGITSPRVTRIRTSEEMARVLEEIVHVLDDNQFSQKDQFAVRLALEEAIVNATKHGNRNDSGKDVRVWWVASQVSLKVVVEDQGSGFTLEQVPDPREDEGLEREGGRGLFLMHSFMSSVRFSRRGNCSRAAF